MALSISRTVVVATLNRAQMKDLTWYANIDVLLVSLEIGIGLVSVCLPAHISLVRCVGMHLLHSHPNPVSSRGEDGIYTGDSTRSWLRSNRRKMRRRPSVGDLEILASSSDQLAETRTSTSSTDVDRERRLECGSEIWDLF